MMQEMFTSSARPFYHSADLLELKAIPPSVYVPFVVGHFEKRHRAIDPADVERVYEMFQGHTYYIQKAFNEAFSDTPEGSRCSIDIIRRSIDTIVESNDTIFREILSNIPEKQKQLLYAIARDGEAKAITSAAFIRRHRLSSASSVQSALLRLVDKDIVSCCADSWTINDRLFRLLATPPLWRPPPTPSPPSDLSLSPPRRMVLTPSEPRRGRADRIPGSERHATACQASAGQGSVTRQPRGKRRGRCAHRHSALRL